MASSDDGGSSPKTAVAVRHACTHPAGRGGKDNIWGKLLQTGGESSSDLNGPNCESGKEPFQALVSTIADPLDDYKKSVTFIIEKYFATNNVALATAELGTLSSAYHYCVIMRLVSMAVVRRYEEKEMASVLLSALNEGVISHAQIVMGFGILLQSADDLALETPNEVDSLASFIARAVVDKIVPPSFLTVAKKALPESSKGIQLIETAEKIVLLDPGLVRRRWGGSTRQRTVAEILDDASELRNRGAIWSAWDTYQVGLKLYPHNSEL